MGWCVGVIVGSCGDRKRETEEGFTLCRKLKGVVAGRQWWVLTSNCLVALHLPDASHPVRIPDVGGQNP